MFSFVDSINLRFLKYILFVTALTAFSPGYGQQEDEKPTFPLDNFYAERKKWPRTFLKDFHLSLSTGYGNTFFRHNLSGFGVFQPTGLQPRVFSIATGARYTNWVNTIRGDTLSSAPTDSYFVSADTAKLGFKGLGLNIPLKATLHYEFLGRYRLGGGYSYDLMVIGPMRPMTFTDKISSFQPSRPAGFMKKYFGMVGFSFYEWKGLLLTVDVNVGGFKPGNNFAMGLIQKGIYVNGGVTVERSFAENIQLFLRPSFEFKNYTISIPGSGGGTIAHAINAFYVNAGFTYSLPELPRCYNKNCEAQLNHAHGDREYRSRMHRFWKKQSPMYGENYPRLLKYKGRNKKKLNPY